ncbi:MAG: hypothetical protein ACE5GX_03105 [Thermoanaerobaculia bacterium]
MKVGSTATTAVTPLHVAKAISGAASVSNHVALIENYSSLSSPDVLALEVTHSATPGSATNFITFFGSGGTGVGAIEGDGSGGVTYKSGAADFAEYLPRLDVAEELQPGDVVGLHGGAVSRRTLGADRVLVVTSRPIVLGNDPNPELKDRYTPVAFLGQVPVRVIGSFRAGDVLLATDREDGTALALTPERLSFDQLPRVVGRALESLPASERQTVQALVGLADPSLIYRVMARYETERASPQLDPSDFPDLVRALDKMRKYASSDR